MSNGTDVTKGGRAPSAIDPNERYVDDTAYDTDSDVDVGGARPDLDMPTGKLIRKRFFRHKLAVISAFFLAFLYLCIPFVELIAPYDANTRDAVHLYAPPQGVHLYHEGEFVGPFVYPTKAEADLEMFRWTYIEDRSTPQKLRFFCSGEEYEFWGLFKADFHFVCPPEDGSFFLLGADRLGGVACV
jgi:peptide/nickel transport system permease protein